MKNNNKTKQTVPNKEGQLGFVFTSGGSRKGAGRKGIGITKKVSLTLSEEVWQQIQDDCEKSNSSKSELFRNIIECYYSLQKNN